MSNKRMYNIDMIKGLLIILVIAGHFILGEVKYNFIRYNIYTFHMPVFIAISGFLINKEKLYSMKFWEVIKRYVPRVIIPWIVAVLVYCTTLNMNKFQNLSIEAIIKVYVKAFVEPYYHLWFVMGYISYIIITWVLLRLRFNNTFLLIATFVFSTISKLRLYDIDNHMVNKIANLIHNDFKLYNLFFFIYGMVIRDIIKKKQISKYLIQISLLLVVLSEVVNIYMYYHTVTEIKRIIYYTINIPLILWLFTSCQKDVFPRQRILEFIGVNSMAFYLWHVLIKIYTVQMAKVYNPYIYYIVSLTLLTLMYIMIYYFSRIKYINRYLLGGREDTGSNDIRLKKYLKKVFIKVHEN